ncbi:hypothetical protein GOP47_0005406 [Adiantum capillus-veneris]|uniref:Histone H2B n=1 Tax=Adiantum capillus-veneris TaxID=13818 RepID=A0A9D4ZN74_ADICA|nr:hypothetical protein GOP47_0005406 [Adiantum capillus-veneris]
MTCTKGSLNEAKISATPKTCSPSRAPGRPPRATCRVLMAAQIKGKRYSRCRSRADAYKEGSDKKKKKKARSTQTYKIYIFKVLKQLHPDKARLARYNKKPTWKPTITNREIQTAVRLLLPGSCVAVSFKVGL